MVADEEGLSDYVMSIRMPGILRTLVRERKLVCTQFVGTKFRRSARATRACDDIMIMLIGWHTLKHDAAMTRQWRRLFYPRVYPNHSSTVLNRFEQRNNYRKLCTFRVNTAVPEFFFNEHQLCIYWSSVSVSVSACSPSSFSTYECENEREKQLKYNAQSLGGRRVGFAQ